MANPGRSPEQEAAFAEAYRQIKAGDYPSKAAAAAAHGIAASTFKDYIREQESKESALADAAREAGFSVDDVTCWWYKNDDVSVLIRQPDGPGYETIRDSLVAELRKYSPKYDRRPIGPSGENLLVLPHADLHIGKFADLREVGSHMDIEQAVDRARRGTDALMEKAQLFGVKSIVLCIGNDLLHYDTPSGSTTAGTGQDTVGSIFTIFDAAKRLYVGLIEQLSLVADVHLQFIPANHDWVSGYMLADTIGSWFHNHPNVHLGEGWGSMSPRHRKYVTYGHNLIMLTHGDGAKEKDLHWHMANEAAEQWGKTKFRYAYCGHLHHKIKKLQGGQKLTLVEKDNVGFTEIMSGHGVDLQANVHVEVVRSPSPPDGWHDRNGYTSKPAMEAFLHHPTDGQVARFTHFF